MKLIKSPGKLLFYRYDHVRSNAGKETFYLEKDEILLEIGQYLFLGPVGLCVPSVGAFEVISAVSRL